jgi:hypothetical protein
MTCMLCGTHYEAGTVTAHKETRAHRTASAHLVLANVWRGLCACGLPVGHDGGEHRQEDIDESIAGALATLDNDKGPAG